MGERSYLADDQLRTLARLSAMPQLAGFYLAGGSAVAVHLRHRRSRDLDLFSLAPDANLEAVRAALLAGLADAQVVSATDASLHLRVGSTPLDVVRYPYPLLESPSLGPSNFPVAGLIDLSTMKLSAVSRRGIRRDFWDLHSMITGGGVTLTSALEAYVKRFGVGESDLYHVLRSLTYFDDAEKETVLPEGLDASGWEMLKAFFRRAAPEALAQRLA